MRNHCYNAWVELFGVSRVSLNHTHNIQFINHELDGDLGVSPRISYELVHTFCWSSSYAHDVYDADYEPLFLPAVQRLLRNSYNFGFPMQGRFQGTSNLDSHARLEVTFF